MLGLHKESPKQLARRVMLLDHALSPSNDTPRLPLELWEAIIDNISLRRDCGFQRDLTGVKVEREKVWQSTLISCALVCKKWYPRSRYHLDRAIYLSSREQVRRLSVRVRSASSTYHGNSTIPYPSSHIIIHGEAGTRLSHYAPALHLGTFAAMLARQLPSATQLTLSSVDWHAGMVQPRCLNLLAAFRGITRLALLSIRVQTLSLIGSVLAAMPCVRILSCADVRCAQEATHAEQPAARCVGAALRELALAWTDRSVIEFLGTVAIVAPPVELLTVRLYARSIANGGLLACHKLLVVYASSLTELRLFVDGEAGDRGAVCELPCTFNAGCLALTHLYAFSTAYELAPMLSDVPEADHSRTSLPEPRERLLLDFLAHVVDFVKRAGTHPHRYQTHSHLGQVRRDELYRSSEGDRG